MGTAWGRSSILREHKDTLQRYNKFLVVDTALRNQIVAVLYDTYLSSLNNAYMGYLARKILEIITYLYANYSRIPATYMETNDACLRSTYNPEEPLESLIKRLNKWAAYAASAGNPVTETRII